MATTPLSNAFITLNDVINNFLISYTGVGRLIPDVERTEVIFHARRCLQEFAYETIKSQFTEGPTAVTTSSAVALPKDFVAVISAINTGFSATTPLVEVSTLAALSTGEFFIDYAAKTIKYGDAGNATLTYLSNALTTDESAAIPKLAEQALYSCIVYSILANKENTRPDILQRLLVEKNDNLERAKSRLVFTNFD
jgi:hypothetical protein|tara:strand:+ start:34 stop:621 length:588 start_codon:yes stop_codon:yes gene_type:complete